MTETAPERPAAAPMARLDLPAAGTEVGNDFETLRSLLMGPEQRRLQVLEGRVEDRGARTRDLAEVLPEAVRLGTQQDQRLSAALAQPLEDSLKQAVRKNTRMLADALFPVMGPAIRRAIGESLRAMLQSLNQILDQSVSVRGLRWRFEAWRSGLPFHEVVLRHTLRYRVEQVLLVHKHTGLLIEHAYHADVAVRDADAISGMLTAIQDFVRDSFTPDRGDELDTVDLGEHTVWLLHGPYATLACVIRGLAPAALRARLQGVLEEIHGAFAKQLESFDGERAEAPGIHDLLEDCLHSEREEPARRRLSPALLVLLTVLLGGIATLAWQLIGQARQTQRLLAVLEAAPGTVVVAIERAGGHYRVRGLRDPLAPAPADLVQAAGLAPPQVTFHWEPYQALDPAIVERRARAILAPPNSARLTLDGTLLVASGHADADWLARARLIATAVPGVSAYDDSELHDLDQVLLERARAALQPPTGVELEVTDAVLRVRGRAPLAWIEQAPTRLAAIADLRGSQLEALRPLEHDEVMRLAGEVDTAEVLFQRGSTDLLDGQEARLAAVAAAIRRLAALAAPLGYRLAVDVLGHTDGTGTPNLNAQLSWHRAREVTRRLSQLGVVESSLHPVGTPPPLVIDDADAGMRRVSFRVHTEGLAAPTAEARQP